MDDPATPCVWLSTSGVAEAMRPASTFSKSTGVNPPTPPMPTSAGASAASVKSASEASEPPPYA